MKLEELRMVVLPYLAGVCSDSQVPERLRLLCQLVREYQQELVLVAVLVVVRVAAPVAVLVVVLAAALVVVVATHLEPENTILKR